MSERPTGRDVLCPECNTKAIAIIPKRSDVIEREDEADGKVVVNCRECGTRFPVHYRTSG